MDREEERKLRRANDAKNVLEKDCLQFLEKINNDFEPNEDPESSCILGRTKCLGKSSQRIQIPSLLNFRNLFKLFSHEL